MENNRKRMEVGRGGFGGLSWGGLMRGDELVGGGGRGKGV